MALIKSEEIRRFIINHVEKHPRDIAKRTAEQFAITRQAVNRHLVTLVEDEILEAKGQTKKREYALKDSSWLEALSLAENPDEDKAWRLHIEPHLGGLPENVLNICHHGFTEIYNNAVDHSEGTIVKITVVRNAKSIQLGIRDDGIGIFEKIKTRCHLEDYRQTLLELAKGKLTTDPARHTGEGIFFTSRAFDTFLIYANETYFGHTPGGDDWLGENQKYIKQGTLVLMKIEVDSTRKMTNVYDQFIRDEPEGEFYFARTHVPLRLAQYGQDKLVSRSQAKRVLARFDRFKEVWLDFTGIDSIGQGFADEIFRVYASTHPNIKFVVAGANEEVEKMIAHVKAGRAAQETPNGPNG